MRRAVIHGVVAAVALLLTVRCLEESREPYGYNVRFLTESYEPFNYLDSGRLTGLAPELLEEICRSLNIPYDVTVMEWEEAYETALEDSRALLFSTSMNSQRKELFKWAGPVASLEWHLYARSPNDITLGSLEDAGRLRAIGVLKDYTIEQFLVKQGFTNLVYCESHIDALQKLLSGAIDLFPSDRFTMESALRGLGKPVYDLEAELPVKTEMIYFAFNKNIPDPVVADFQKEIDRLKNNGFLRQLYQQFLRSSDSPGILQVYTEEYPPLTFMGRFGEISGYGTDIVREIMKRNRVFEPIRISTWSNGYELALDNPNFCLFTMDRTPIRESLFQWVGPIGTNTTWFYVKKGSGIAIGSLEEARNLASVGTVKSWFSDQYLRSLGFTNLTAGEDPAEMTDKLMKGEVDAFVCTGITFPDILAGAGYSRGDAVPAFALMSSDFYISFSRSTSPVVVEPWRAAFQAMKEDGTVASIHRRWFPGEEQAIP